MLSTKLRILVAAFCVVCVSSHRAASGQSLAISGAPERLGAGLRVRDVVVTLDPPAPTNTTLRIDSSDGDVCRVSTSSSFSTGMASIELAVAAGQSSVLFAVEGVRGATGEALLTASVPGYSPIAKELAVVRPTARIVGLPSELGLFAERAFTLQVGIPNVAGTEFEAAQAVAPPTQLTVTVTSSVPTVASILRQFQLAESQPALIGVGQSESAATQSSGGVSFASINKGNTTISVTSDSLETIPGVTTRDVAVIREPLVVQQSTIRVGAGLQLPTVTVSVSGPRHPSFDIRVESSDPTLVGLSATRFGLAQSAVDIRLLDGQTSATYCVQGVGSSPGRATLTLSVPGLEGTTQEIEVVEPVVRLRDVPISLSAIGPDAPIRAEIGVLDPSGTVFSELQEIRTGTLRTVSFRSSNAATALMRTVSSSAQEVFLTLLANETATASGAVAIDPRGIGTTTIRAGISGFSSLPDGGEPVTLTPGTISVPGPVRVGRGLVGGPFIARLSGGGHPGTSILIESADPDRIQLAAAPAVQPSGAIFLTVGAGQTDAQFYAYAMDDAMGEVALTVTSPVTSNGSGTLSIEQPAIQILDLAPSIGVLDSFDFFRAQLGLSNAAGTGLDLIQPRRFGGTPVAVVLTSTNPAVGLLRSGSTSAPTATVFVQPGQSLSTPSSAVSFDATSPGTTQVLPASPGYREVPSGGFLVTVLPVTSGFSFIGFPVSIGAGLSPDGPMRVAIPSPHGEFLLRVESDDPSRLLVSALVGETPRAAVEFVVPQGTSTSATFRLHAVPGAALGQATIRAAIVGSPSISTSVNIVQPTFEIVGVPPRAPGTGDVVPFQIRLGIADQFGTRLGIQQLASVGFPVTVELRSINPEIARLVTLDGEGGTRTVVVPGGSALSPTTVATGGVGVRAVDVGMTTIEAMIPGYVALPGSTVPFEVVCPGDSNNDDIVDLADLALMILNWDQFVEGGTRGDVNFDGRVSMSDAALALANWGEVCD